MFAIVTNSVFLGLQDYANPDSDYWGNNLVNYSEYIFTFIFTLEAFLKIVAYGFIMSPGCYLRDAWNWIDFIVVLTSLVGILGNSNISGVRTFRIFRPLKSLSALPSMRILVTTLLQSLV